jgi:hypothetical protein
MKHFDAPHCQGGVGGMHETGARVQAMRRACCLKHAVANLVRVLPQQLLSYIWDYVCACTAVVFQRSQPSPLCMELRVQCSG